MTQTIQQSGLVVQEESGQENPGGLPTEMLAKSNSKRTK
jgi:hypothetical protein